SDERGTVQLDVVGQGGGRSAEGADRDHQPFDRPEDLPPAGIEDQRSSGEEHGGEVGGVGARTHGAMLVAGVGCVGGGQLCARMNSSTRRQASADSSAYSACLRSKNEWGAPG